MARFEPGSSSKYLSPRPLKKAALEAAFFNGRGERIRTSGLLLPKQTRYQAALRPTIKCLSFKAGRGERIRTSDLLHPKQLRYQAALHPVCSERNPRGALHAFFSQAPQAPVVGKIEPCRLLSTPYGGSRKKPWIRAKARLTAQTTTGTDKKNCPRACYRLPVKPRPAPADEPRSRPAPWDLRRSAP